ncbi:MAG: DUF4835 family protein [Ignavibacteriales bacterium]|nr:MAG: DUF4835 family protein [Ignavibacteriaceae bacterium]MBW7874003.1 DUF4835 family protein [Ignavibacteria bacterium]MCZ2143103.1 DUF4835 family protein [Ignavibacteriales bacterium]OQY75732.1 MAG: hypothetical protein B6D45_05260 [Ignavibacteriales bacterium UTCHB3]MBV6443984.1 hypothetical protein [Ignavibacteriaceae bacterium]
MKKILILFVFAAGMLFPQELDATVQVNNEKLTIKYRELLSDFAPMIQTYLNTTKFSGSSWEYDKIKCSFNIFFTAASDESNYSAQVVVTSMRQIYNSDNYSPMLNVNDPTWSFTYEKNQGIYFDPNVFNSLNSFLDYYAYLIIGLENDSWEKGSGTPFFQKAFDVVNLANGKRASGWGSGGSYNKTDLIQNIMDDKYRAFRDATSDYHRGIDLFAKNKAKGQELIVNMIKVLDGMKSKIDIRSVYLKVFFDAKSGEIIERLKDYPEKSIFKTLKAVDPPRFAKYDEAMRDE